MLLKKVILAKLAHCTQFWGFWGNVAREFSHKKVMNVMRGWSCLWSNGFSGKTSRLKVGCFSGLSFWDNPTGKNGCSDEGWVVYLRFQAGMVSLSSVVVVNFTWQSFFNSFCWLCFRLYPSFLMTLSPLSSGFFSGFFRLVKVFGLCSIKSRLRVSLISWALDGSLAIMSASAIWLTSGLVTNSILFSWLFTAKNRCKKSAFSTNAQSRFVSVVIDGVLGPPRLA